MASRNDKTITRREMLATAGITAGAAVLPGVGEAAAATGHWDLDSDVVCIGGGAAGCAAAVTATERGAKVILLERAPMLGGTTRKSGGVAWVPNHSLLRKQGIKDEKSDCMAYMARFAYPHRYVAGHPTLGLDARSHSVLNAFYDHGAEAIDKLMSSGAVQFGTFLVGGKPSPDYADHLPENKVPAGRALVPLDADGKLMAGTVGHGGRIVDACEAWLLKRGASVLTEHRVTRVVQEDGRVIGVEAETGGRTVRIRARKGVVFATGGYAHNEDMIQRHLRFLYGSCAVPQSQGDFVNIAGAVGAAMGQMDLAWRTQVVLEQALENHVLAVGVFFVPSDSMVLVNKYGRRAVNEKRNYNDRTRVHYTYDPVAEEYPNQFLYMVFDERSRDAFGGAYPIPVDAKTSYLISGNTLEELAANIRARMAGIASRTGGAGIAPSFEANLADTVKRFNEYARQGKDPEFGRGAQSYDREWQSYFSMMREGSRQKANDMPNPTMYPIADQGPYHAIILAAGALDTNGGPLTNEHGQVLATNGAPIPGLYGAGNCICSPTRDAYMGAGGTLGPAMTFGYLAALHATST
jgi:3-oxosteroid 1-dehydrogenase